MSIYRLEGFYYLLSYNFFLYTPLKIMVLVIYICIFITPFFYRTYD